MSRVQLALNVSNIDEAVAFYSRFFGAEPAKRRPGYANFTIADPPLKLVLIEGGEPGTLNHLGVEVPSTEDVAGEASRLGGEGFELRHEKGVSCCYAVQDKFWVSGTDRREWEVYTVLGEAPKLAPETNADGAACCSGEKASACGAEEKSNGTDDSMRPIHGSSAWQGPELAGSDEWIYPLSPQELSDVERVVSELRASGKRREDITPSDVRLGTLAPAVAVWRDELARGRGFVLVRGLPVDRLGEEDAELAYWALGLHLGTPVPQNFQAELLTHVRDTGADPNDPATRLYKTRVEQDFHTDAADIIGLLCLRPSRSGGQSRIVSSVTVFNEILRKRPDLAPVLFRDFYWHYFEPEMGNPVHFVRPICAERGGGLNTFFIPWYIRRAQELPDVPPMTAEQKEAVALVESTANDPSLYLDMEFRPGDIQFLKNSVILHKRTAYEDWDEPERKRHLVRLWLAAPDFYDGDEQLRRGITVGA